jgi:hypothetical protein
MVDSEFIPMKEELKLTLKRVLDYDMQRSRFLAISRSRAVWQRTEKRLGHSEASSRGRPFFANSAG